jgi:hypothetical protein
LAIAAFPNSSHVPKAHSKLSIDALVERGWDFTTGMDEVRVRGFGMP